MSDAIKKWILAFTLDFCTEYESGKADQDWCLKTKRAQVTQVKEFPIILQFLSVRSLANPTAPIKITLSDKFHSVDAILTNDCIHE
jgi:hypothetical protein